MVSLHKYDFTKAPKDSIQKWDIFWKLLHKIIFVLKYNLYVLQKIIFLQWSV